MTEKWYDFAPTRRVQREKASLIKEETRDELEKRRSGMPGSIRRNGKWTRERKDGSMAFQAKADWMVREIWPS